MCTCLQSLTLSLQAQRYITEDERAPGIPEPEVPVLPERFKDDPHKYIAQLNGGTLPYEFAGKPPQASAVISRQFAVVT